MARREAASVLTSACMMLAPCSFRSPVTSARSPGRSLFVLKVTVEPLPIISLNVDWTALAVTPLQTTCCFWALSRGKLTTSIRGFDASTWISTGGKEAEHVSCWMDMRRGSSSATCSQTLPPGHASRTRYSKSPRVEGSLAGFWDCSTIGKGADFVRCNEAKPASSRAKVFSGTHSPVAASSMPYTCVACCFAASVLISA
mmetsp:Transcript_80962/g.142799  ORF Transcript_80962/g.142799 Transcript_80962/m.142799 type:complete len:200 (+) Transcript_80962:279-878(+)